MISLIFAAIIPIAHIWETNSTPTVRRFYTYSANSYKLIPTPNYVTNGLTHWWDGQINVRIGWHKDGNIAFWKDLVGDNDLLITSTNIYFTKKGLRCPNYKVNTSKWGTRTAGLARGEQIPSDDCKTIEVCVRSRIYYAGTYIKAEVSTDQYNMLVSNGKESYQYQSSYPIFIAFHNQSGTASRYGGGPYFAIFGRSPNYGVRCLSFSNEYEMFGDGFNFIYDTFNLSYSNANAAQYNPSSPYHQPYWSAKINYVRFARSYDSCIITHEDEAPKYTYIGNIEDSSLLKPDPNFRYFSIGGSCEQTSSFGTIVIREYNFWNGDIFCVRVYNRELSAEEREQNTKIDYERFNGVD